MKTLYKNTLFALLLAVGFTATAQSLVNEKGETQLEVIHTNKKAVIIKTIITETQPIIFDDSNINSLNTVPEESPVTVERIVLIDDDLDTNYDSKIKLEYVRKANESLSFKYTKDGLFLIDNASNSYLINEDTEELSMADGDNVEVDFIKLD